jgi:hypothetical protein
VAACLTSALGGSGWLTPRPSHFTRRKDRNPLYRKLGGPQDLSGWVRKISPPRGLDSRTVLQVNVKVNLYQINDHAVKPYRGREV